MREIELNRRFAPDVYLGVAEVRDPAGRHATIWSSCAGCRRSDLSALVRAGAPVDRPVRQVARTLAAGHASAARSAADRRRATGCAARRWEDNLSQTCGTRPGAGASRSPRSARWPEFLAGGSRCSGQIDAGRIVDGHGDLLADDIYCLDDGPRILDCLDFDDQLRWLDGLDDAAFLAMDLERLGAAELARQFIDWYAEYSGDLAPASLVITTSPIGPSCEPR